MAQPRPISHTIPTITIPTITAAVICTVLYLAETRDTRAAVRTARAEGYAAGREDGYVDGYIHRAHRAPASPEEIEAMRPARRRLYPVR